MLLGNGEHLVADVAVRYNVVAQKNQEVLPCHGVGSRANSMAEALGLVLITEVDRHTASVGDGIGIGALAALAQQVLERTVGLEVVQQLGLAGRGNDDGVVDLLGVEGLLDDILDDGLVEHRQHLFGRALGARQKTRAKTGNGKNGFGNFFRNHFDSAFNNRMQFQVKTNRLLEHVAGLRFITGTLFKSFIQFVHSVNDEYKINR